MDSINVVWFKRDLRLSDHQPLKRALLTRKNTLLLYIFEPELIKDNHYSERHWRFVWQSIEDINRELTAYEYKLCVAQGSPKAVCSRR